MRCLFLLLALLGGCPHHQVAVTTTIGPDGKGSRKIVFREKENNRVWGFFAGPGAPYELAGKPEDGVVATASFKSGVNPGGLRFWRHEKKHPNRKTTRGSRVVVQIDDIVVGRVCSYRERIDLGLDPGRFRKELPDWLGDGIAIYHQALKARFPGVDFAPLRKHVDEKLKPRLVRTLARLQLVAAGLMAEYQSSRVRGDEPDWSRSVFVRSVLAELVEWEILTAKEATPEWLEKQIRAVKEEEEKVAAEWSIRMQAWLGRQLAPGLKHLDKEILGKVRSNFVMPDDQFTEALEAAAAQRFPDEKETGRRLQDFGVSVLGAGIFAIFDTVRIEFETTLPGRVVYTNGEIVRGRAARRAGTGRGDPGEIVRWFVGEADLFFVDPLLHATSFELRPWAAKIAAANKTVLRARAINEKLAGLAIDKVAAGPALAEARRVGAIEDDAERAKAVEKLSKPARNIWDAGLRFLKREPDPD